MIERAEGTDLIDGRRRALHRRHLVAVVQRPRAPPPDRSTRPSATSSTGSPTRRCSASPTGPRPSSPRGCVELAPPGLTRVFYSDSGSTATEIALKMAFQYWRQRGGQHARRTSFVGLADGYHGDTIGAVSVGGIDLFHGAYEPLLFPKHNVPAGDAARAASRARALRRGDRGGDRRAAGAGRRRHPRRSRPATCAASASSATRHGVLLICDEVATGFGRTGTMFACEQERVAPDFLCLGKGLTNGYMPLAATLTTERVYEGFLGEHEELPHLLPRPHVHRQPARLRGGDRQPRRLRATSTRCCGSSRRSGCSTSCSPRSRRWTRSARSAAAG